MSAGPPLIEAYRGKRAAHPPVWFMRQAGRFLPEYRKLRQDYRMLELLSTPKLAAEVTLQPLERFDLDGAIIFADILTPLIGMGIELDFIEGEGPRIFNPIKEPQDVSRLRLVPAAESVGYTLEAIKLVVERLKSRQVPLLGFSGAPFTLSSYLIPGKSSAGHAELKTFMLNQPESWHELQTKLAMMISEYLVAQIRAGVSAVQLFDSWLGHLGPQEFERFALPYLKEIVGAVRAQSSAPIIYFSTGTAGLLHRFRELSVDALSIDWRISLSQADNLLGHSLPLQGNLDPAVLAGPIDYLEKEVETITQQGKELVAHIFNLGHGILPHTPIENVTRVVELVKG